MWWDPAARKKNLSDRRWQLRIKPVEREEFEERWPDIDIESAISPWDKPGEDDVATGQHTYPQDAYKDQSSRSGLRDRDRIKVAQLQWFEHEEVYRVGEQAVEFPAAEFARLKDKFDARGIEYIKQRRRVYKQAFVAGNVVLEEGPSPYPEGFTFCAMTGKRDRNKNVWVGLVHAMKDPQRFGNKFFSQILDILNKGAKGGVLAETDAVDDPREMEEKWARPDSVIWVSPGAIAGKKIMPKPVAEYPAGLDRLMEFSMDSVNDVSGVNLEMLGLAGRDQPGVLEYQRKQAGLTILGYLFDALRKYRKEQGRVLLYMIRTYISDGRLVKIVGENGADQYVPLVRDENTARYDVIVDEAPTSPNQKERVFGALTQMLPALTKAGIPLPPELLDYAPIPSSLAAKWKEQIQGAGGKVPPEIQQQLEKLAGENRQLKDKRAEAQEALEIKRLESDAEIELKRDDQRAEQELAERKAAAEIRLKGAIAEDENVLEMKKLNETLAIMRARAAGELEIKRQGAED